ncbi:MAG: GGDEF domain-containing protein [Devosia sp.]|nr:GGDEF domain-containing protein [Devosia sp.]
MQIDTVTLLIPGGFASALAGVSLLAVWVQNRRALALLWWAAATLLDAAGVAVLIAGLAGGNPLLTMTGTGVSTLAPALIWGGIRAFSGRRAPLVLILAGPAAWLISGGIEHLMHLDHQMWSTLISFALWQVYLPAGIWELWRGREEKLVARWPLAVIMTLHAVVFLGGSYDLLTGAALYGQPPALFSWFGSIYLESIAFAMTGSTLLILLCKERVERGHIEAAAIDALTGIANRRRLLEGGERLLSRCRDARAPLSIVMFDLDHFKLINDNLGHEVGDRVLRGFAQTVQATIRPTDLFGRYGGEEFVLVMPNVSIETAWAIADRARQQFALDYKFIDGRPLGATVSAGVALAGPDETLDKAIVAADGAMYLAKKGGRNRVARAEPPDPSDRSDNVIRIA